MFQKRGERMDDFIAGSKKAAQQEETYVLEMNHISKSFPGVKALQDVHLNLKKGEVLALMGENGAGKSTLMNVLCGVHHCDSGDILINGEKVEIHNQQDANARGIAMVYQELNPLLYLSIADNIFLNREFRKGGVFLDKRRANLEAQKLLDEFGVKRSATTRMSKLSLAEMQMVEIIKAVSRDASIIIMDEPTSSLTNNEVETLYRTVTKLKANGVSIIFISHRMEDIFALADRVTVMRDSRTVGTCDIGDVDEKQLISMMVGRELSELFPKMEFPLGEKVLEVKDLCCEGVFQNISFDVRRGEILGVAGLVGAGRSEIMQAIFGLRRYQSGEVVLEGKALHNHHPSEAIKNGIVMVSEDRKTYGLVLCRSIGENISLPNLKYFSAKGFLQKRRERSADLKIAQQIGVKMSGLNQEASKLSGGNQQKVVLAKWLVQQPKVMILDEPTRGIDVGAKAEIHRLMSQLASQGMAIIMISSEMPEVLGMSDRVLVISNGRVAGKLDRSEATQEKIMEYAVGGLDGE